MDKNVDYDKIRSSAAARQRTIRIITYILLAFWAVIVLFPFYWMVLTSVKSYSAYSSEYIPKLYTLNPTFQNYVDAFTAVNLSRYFLNTIIGYSEHLPPPKPLLRKSPSLLPDCPQARKHLIRKSSAGDPS